MAAKDGNDPSANVVSNDSDNDATLKSAETNLPEQSNVAPSARSSRKPSSPKTQKIKSPTPPADTSATLNMEGDDNGGKSSSPKAQKKNRPSAAAVQPKSKIQQSNGAAETFGKSSSPEANKKNKSLAPSRNPRLLLNKKGRTNVAKKTRKAAGNDASSATKWNARFIPKEPVPPFVWNASQDPKFSASCPDLLVNEMYIDKSEALFSLLQSFYNRKKNDFESTAILLAYPRRFAKSTLLGLIEAVYSPLPILDGFTSALVKTKVAALKRGKDLLAFGLHPVVNLDLQWISSVESLNNQIQSQLKQAGLDDFDLRSLTKRMKPVDRLITGVLLLNEKFLAETGVSSKTIVMIDEYDKPFRKRENKMQSPFLRELIDLFSIGKSGRVVTGISLLVLCGLTRMVGTGLSSLNNLMDVSRITFYHGLCGISSREFVACADGQLDDAAMRKYNNQNLATLLDSKFRKEWNGFRFGLDERVGDLDPGSADGALFSPLDVWEIVQSLLRDKKTPSSQWIETMYAEFEFTSFSNKFTSEKGYVELFQNLLGGWLKTDTIKKQMSRETYLELDTNESVKKVLFELGLLSVKEIHGNSVRLYSPNFMITRNAMEQLVSKTKRGETPEDFAKEYLSESGFRGILSGAAKTITNVYAQTSEYILREFPFQDFLYLQLSCYFPTVVPQDSRGPCYMLYHEATVNRTLESGTISGRVDVALVLNYENSPTTVYLMELKIETIPTNEDAIIQLNHDINIKKATPQVLSYIWYEPVGMTVWVAVSGVWHPAKNSDGYELSCDFEFVSPAI